MHFLNKLGNQSWADEEIKLKVFLLIKDIVDIQDATQIIMQYGIAAKIRTYEDNISFMVSQITSSYYNKLEPNKSPRI